MIGENPFNQYNAVIDREIYKVQVSLLKLRECYALHIPIPDPYYLEFKRARKEVRQLLDGLENKIDLVYRSQQARKVVTPSDACEPF